MKHIICSLCLLISIGVCSAESICIDSPRDYTILSRFFKNTILSEEYGYVLEGAKPVSIRHFASLDNFPITKDLGGSAEQFEYALLIREAVPIWNRLCSQQQNFVLKTVVLDEAPVPSLEVLFINVSKLREVVEKNIGLFRFVLGPTITVRQIVDRIVGSQQPLIEILQHNLSLVGIVLGFGSHNSLVGGRLETILAQSISKDLAPFTSQSYLMQREGNHSLDFLTWDRYGLYYLEKAGGDDTNFRNDLPLLQPLKGFGNLEDEVIALDELNEPLPSSLWEQPKFVFGAFKGGGSNKPFFEKLQRTQKRIRVLLKKPTLLESILEKIGGKKPVVRVDKNALSKVTLNHLTEESWAQILWNKANRFEGTARKLAFIEAFRNPTASSRVPPTMLGASIAGLEGLKIALRNLGEANKQFEGLSRDASLKTIVPKQLYFKTIQPGKGEKVNEAEHVRVGYVIEDPEGNVLFANHDIWLHLSQTIPGFAHGVHGMHVGEKRKISIHPVLGYGALTTLPPCIALTVTVRLLDIDSQTSGNLPSLAAIDLSWLQDTSFYRSIEESLEQQPRYFGSCYRDLINKMEWLDLTVLNTELDKLASEIK